jgi:uncharacterized protein with HEPN domain
MIAAGELVQRFAKGGRARYDKDVLIRSGIQRQMEILGEAARRVSDPFKARHPEIPWRSATALRNVLSHGYDDVDDDLVWKAVGRTINETLPALRRLHGRDGGA